MKMKARKKHDKLNTKTCVIAFIRGKDRKNGFLSPELYLQLTHTKEAVPQVPPGDGYAACTSGAEDPSHHTDPTASSAHLQGAQHIPSLSQRSLLAFQLNLRSWCCWDSLRHLEEDSAGHAQPQLFIPTTMFQCSTTYPHLARFHALTWTTQAFLV